MKFERIKIDTTGSDSWSDYEMIKPIFIENSDDFALETKEAIVKMSREYWKDADKSEWKARYDPSKIFEKILDHMEKRFGEENPIHHECLIWGMIYVGHGFGGSCFALNIFLDFQGTLYKIVTCDELDEPVAGYEEYIR